jgi:hypothetical protein
VLQRSDLGQAVIEALKKRNPQVEIIDRGSYLRVLAPSPCVLSRADVEERTASSFELPGDLESIMSSFKGELSLSASEASWVYRGAYRGLPQSKEPCA